MAQLVDLSLFSMAPHDGHFAVGDGYAGPTYGGSVHVLAQPMSTMKPLPPIPRQKKASFRPDPRSQLANPSRVILEKMKRLRIDTAGASAGMTLRPARSMQTLQQRRRRDEIDAPALTIPTGPLSGHGPTHAPRADAPQGVPMIWLVDEQRWLASEAAEREQQLYGYYAPPLHSDPGPWGYVRPGRSFESPPAYSASSASPADPSDLSPVRTQFLSLMESRPQENPLAASSVPWALDPRPLHNDKAISPLFQQALSGVGFVPFTQAASEPEAPRQPAAAAAGRAALRKESDAFVSPLTPDGDRRPIAWPMRRCATALT